MKLVCVKYILPTPVYASNLIPETCEVETASASKLLLDLAEIAVPIVCWMLMQENLLPS